MTERASMRRHALTECGHTSLVDGQAGLSVPEHRALRREVVFGCRGDVDGDAKVLQRLESARRSLKKEASFIKKSHLHIDGNFVFVEKLWQLSISITRGQT